MKKETVKKDGRTKQAKAERQRERAHKLLMTAHPDNMRIAISVAQGKATNVICPHCEKTFDIKIGEGSNKEILKELIQQVDGKPKQPIDAEINAKVDLDSPRLISLYRQLQDFIEVQKKTNSIEIAEAKFKEIPVPELPKLESGNNPPVTIPDQQVSVPMDPKPTEVQIYVPEQYGVKDGS